MTVGCNKTEPPINKAPTCYITSPKNGDEMVKGEIKEVNILAEKGGELKLKSPFKRNDFKCSSSYKIENNIIVVQTLEGQTIRIEQQ